MTDKQKQQLIVDFIGELNESQRNAYMTMYLEDLPKDKIAKLSGFKDEQNYDKYEYEKDL